jgi:hypothetical protein
MFGVYGSVIPSDVIRRIILDKIGQLKGDSLKARSVRSMMMLGIGTVFERGLNTSLSWMVVVCLATQRNVPF